jgi:AbrB family looped-hinge helix DNA binding protein
MTLSKVQARGQVTLPRSIRQTAEVKPGDVVAFRVTGPGTVELRVLTRLTLADSFTRYRIEGPIDEAADRATWQRQAAEDALGA